MTRRNILIVISLLILPLLVGCSSSSASTPTAQEQLCTNLHDLQDSMNALLDRGSNESMSDFTAKWNQVKADMNDVKTAAQPVASASTQALSTSFASLTQAIQSAKSAASVADALTQIQTAANQFVNDLNAIVSDLKCS